MDFSRLFELLTRKLSFKNEFSGAVSLAITGYLYLNKTFAFESLWLWLPTGVFLFLTIRILLRPLEWVISTIEQKVNEFEKTEDMKIALTNLHENEIHVLSEFVKNKTLILNVKDSNTYQYLTLLQSEGIIKLKTFHRRFGDNDTYQITLRKDIYEYLTRNNNRNAIILGFIEPSTP